MNFSEVLFMSCLDDRKLFGYLPYADRIQNPIEKVQDFVNDGYIRLSTPEDNLNRITVSELRKILAEHELPTKGTKTVLTSAIIENLPRTAYESIAKAGTKLYLTEKARTLLKGFDYLFWYEENKSVLYRITETDIRNLADRTPALEMINAIQSLNRKRRLQETSYISQSNIDMYNELREQSCIICGSRDAGSYDLCESCQHKQLTDNQAFHICQLFSYKNKAVLHTLESDMCASYNEGIPEQSVQDYKNYCYGHGTPGILYYSERKQRADRQEDPTPGSQTDLLKRFG